MDKIAQNKEGMSLQNGVFFLYSGLPVDLMERDVQDFSIMPGMTSRYFTWVCYIYGETLGQFIPKGFQVAMQHWRCQAVFKNLELRRNAGPNV